MSAVLVFPAGGRRRAEHNFAPGGSAEVTVPVEGGCTVISGRGSAARAAVLGAGAGIPGGGARVSPHGTECCHLAGEVLDTLQK
jgi:hypothetical protein